MSRMLVPNLHTKIFNLTGTNFLFFPAHKHRTNFFIETGGDVFLWVGRDLEPDVSKWWHIQTHLEDDLFSDGVYGPLFLVSASSTQVKIVSPLVENPLIIEGPPTEPVPPTIDVQPDDVTVTAPDTAVISYVASHPTETTLFYAWLCEDEPNSGILVNVTSVFPPEKLEGEDTSNLSILDTVPEDGRSFVGRVRAYNNNNEYQTLTEWAELTVEVAEYFHDFTTGDIGAWNHTRGSIATAPDVSGIIQTYTGDEPAFYRNQGLQLEAASTNLVTHTIPSAANGWIGAVDYTPYPDILAPDGSTDTVLVENGTAGWIEGAVAATGDSMSIWARAMPGEGGGSAYLMDFNGRPEALFTLTEEWVRYELDADEASAGFPSLYAVDTRGSATLNRALVWLPQGEESAFTTSAIPTSGAPVTRNDTQCQATFAELGAPLPAGGVVNDFCFQFVCHLAYDFEEYSNGSKRFFSLRDNLDETSTVGLFSNSPANLRAWVLKDGAASNVNISEPDLELLGEGDYIDFRFRASSTDGLKLWAITRLGTFTGESSADTANFTNPLMYAIPGRRNPSSNANISNIINRSIRLVPEALSDEEIEGWD